MEKYIYDNNNGLWYELQGAYYIPCMGLAEKEGITEQLKAQDQLAWVGAMNNIRNRAEEIVLTEIIHG